VDSKSIWTRPSTGPAQPGLSSLRPTRISPSVPRPNRALSSQPQRPAPPLAPFLLHPSPAAASLTDRRSAPYFCPPDPPLQTRGGEAAAPRKMGWKAAEKLIRHWKILRGDNVISLVLPPAAQLVFSVLLSSHCKISHSHFFPLPGDDHQRQGQGRDRAHQAGDSVAESRHRRGQELGNLLSVALPQLLTRVLNQCKRCVCHHPSSRLNWTQLSCIIGCINSIKPIPQ
jgi:hypothetical protein